MELATIEDRLRNPRWSTFYAAGQTTRPKLERSNLAEMLSNPGFQLSVVPNATDDTETWKIWADRSGLVRVELEVGDGVETTMWDGNTQRSYSASGQVVTTNEDPKLEHGLFGLERIVNSRLVVDALTFSLASTDSWMGRSVVHLDGVAIPDEQAIPLSGSMADIKHSISWYRLAIGGDLYMVTVDAATGMVLTFAVRYLSVQVLTEKVETVEFDLPLDPEIFRTR